MDLYPNPESVENGTEIIILDTSRDRNHTNDATVEVGETYFVRNGDSGKLFLCNSYEKAKLFKEYDTIFICGNNSKEKYFKVKTISCLLDELDIKVAEYEKRLNISKP